MRLSKILFTILLVLLCSTAQAATYYVKSDGNDSLAGTSDAAAWRTLSKVNATSFTAGDDIYFKCGGTWVGTLTISHAGTASASARITGYADAGSSTTTVTTSAAHGFSNGDSITIEGTNNFDGTYSITGASGSTFVISKIYAVGDTTGYAHKNLNRVVVGAYYLAGGTETVGVSGNRPVIDGQGTYGGSTTQCLVRAHRDYVTIQDLEIKRSAGEGIRVSDVTDGSTWPYSSGGRYVNITNCLIHDHVGCGLRYWQQCHYGIASGNTVYTVGSISSGDWPSALDTTATIGTIFRNNTVYNSVGEGIMAGRGANYNLLTDGTVIENNVVYNSRRVGIYVACAQNTVVRRNMVYGTSNSTWWLDGDASRGPQAGIVFTFETDIGNCHWTGYGEEGHQAYGNFVAYCTPNIWVAGDTVDNTQAYIYNNTLVDAFNYTPDDSGAIRLDNLVTGTVIKNNLIMQEGSNNIARLVGYNGSVTWDYNLWSRIPPAGARGTHDPGYPSYSTTYTPTTIGLTKTSGWTSITEGTLTGSSFDLTAGSPAIDVGLNLGSPYDHIADAGYSTWPSAVVVRDQDGQGSGWEIGADIYLAGAPVPCGNGVVDPGETCSNCPADVGACPPASTEICYDMDDAHISSNTILDQCDSTDATKSGTTSTTGKNGQARLFNGTSDYISIPTKTVANSDFTVAFGVKPSTTPPDAQCLFSMHTASATDQSFHLRLYSTGKLRIGYYADDINTEDGVVPIDGSTWTHIAVAYNALVDITRVYINGVEKTSSSAGPFTGASPTISIGKWITGTEQYMKGAIDDFHFYPGQYLEASDISTVYDSFLGVTAAPLTLTEIATPVVPLSGIPTYTFSSSKTGTITAMTGPCKTDTTSVVVGNNSINFHRLWKGSYSGCTLTVTDADAQTQTLSISPFIVDTGSLTVGSGSITIVPVP